MSEAAQLAEKMEKMVSAMTLMASMLGTRLDRAQLAERFGVCRNTLRSRMEKYHDFPRPGRDGKWLLSEVIEWEQRQS